MGHDQDQQVNKNVALFLTDRLKEAWRNLMEEFQQSFGLDQLDSVLSMLKQLDCASPATKKRFQFMQQEDGESENNKCSDNSSLEKKVFGNHLLSKSVFKCLPVADLLSCRLMNSHWNEYATEILLKREYEIKFQNKINRFYLSGSNWKSLDMFTQLLRTAKNFPCNKFVFIGGNLGNDDAQRFFNFYGPSIKNIEIILHDPDLLNDSAKSETGFSVDLTDLEVIGTILSHQLMNLENLELDLSYEENSEWSGFESLLFPPEKNILLPNLKKLKYASDHHDDGPLLRQLLVAATNLARFSFKDKFCFVGNSDDLIRTEKVKCITNFMFSTEIEELEKLEEILKYEPKLSWLTLKDLPQSHSHSTTWKKISTVLAQLLSSSQSSLEKVGLASLGFLHQLQLPVLQNVTELKLIVSKNPAFNSKDIHDYSFSFLPRGANFSRSFPRLKSVSINFDFEISSEDAAEWWSKYFPTDEIVPTVKNLNIGWHSCPNLWMEKFSKMFPNLEKLSVWSINDFPSISKIIWTQYTKLKSLEVGLDMTSPLNKHPALDSSFTGLSLEMCKQLGELSTLELESMAGNYMGDEPSLLNLTELRTLEIYFSFSDASNYKFSPILTLLTGIFVFKPLESLQQVNIKYPKEDLQKKAKKSILPNLELLSPYKVKIQVTDE